MELTTDPTKFFSIICRDGLLQAPLSIVIFVGVFSKIKSHEDTFYTSDSVQRVNNLLSILCDRVPKYDQNDLMDLIDDYNVNKRSIISDSVYRLYEFKSGTKYFSLHIEYDIELKNRHSGPADDNFQVHPKYVKYGKLLKIRGREYQQEYLEIGETKYEIVIENNRIKFANEDVIEIKSDFEIFGDRIKQFVKEIESMTCNSDFAKMVEYYGDIDKMRSGLIR